MSDRPHGKHVVIDSDNPEALGICDKTGFVFKRKDLVGQMEWRGNALVYTGFLVGRPYVDTPNEQLRPPILPPDPVPVMMPRLPQPSTIVWENQSTNWEDIDFLTWDQWEGVFDGILASSEADRLAALQQGIEPNPVLYGAAANSVPEETQAQILSSLQNFHWSA